MLHQHPGGKVFQSAFLFTSRFPFLFIASAVLTHGRDSEGPQVLWSVRWTSCNLSFILWWRQARPKYGAVNTNHRSQGDPDTHKHMKYVSADRCLHVCMQPDRGHITLHVPLLVCCWWTFLSSLSLFWDSCVASFSSSAGVDTCAATFQLMKTEIRPSRLFSNPVVVACERFTTNYSLYTHPALSSPVINTLKKWQLPPTPPSSYYINFPPLKAQFFQTFNPGFAGMYHTGTSLLACICQRELGADFYVYIRLEHREKRR